MTAEQSSLNFLTIQLDVSFEDGTPADPATADVAIRLTGWTPVEYEWENDIWLVDVPASVFARLQREGSVAAQALVGKPARLVLLQAEWP